MSKRLDLVGQRFGRLTVISFDSVRNGRSYWKCKCDCGNTTVVAGSDLKRKQTVSCGCYKKEIKVKHNAKGSRLYTIWKNMRQRCKNPNSTSYKYYGKRNICITPEWDDFSVFREWAMANGYNDNLSIDRIDVNGNYEPSNCRWVSKAEQARNTRRNRYVDYQGKHVCVAEASRLSGIKNETLCNRLKRGESNVFRKTKTHKIIIKYRGQYRPLADIARELNIHHDTLYDRYRRGDRGDKLFRPVEKK